MQNADPQRRFRRFKKKSYSANISLNNQKNQKKLYRYIAQKRLSDSLELLQASGYFGDDAIRRLQYLKREEIC